MKDVERCRVYVTEDVSLKHICQPVGNIYISVLSLLSGYKDKLLLLIVLHNKLVKTWISH